MLKLIAKNKNMLLWFHFGCTLVQCYIRLKFYRFVVRWLHHNFKKLKQDTSLLQVKHTALQKLVFEQVLKGF